jgi:hypothetical protein
MHACIHVCEEGVGGGEAHHGRRGGGKKGMLDLKDECALQGLAVYVVKDEGALQGLLL